MYLVNIKRYLSEGYIFTIEVQQQLITQHFSYQTFVHHYKNSILVQIEIFQFFS